MRPELDEPGRDWTSPGAFQVAPGVYRVPLPLPGDGLRAVNVYVLQTDDGPVLIDSGWALEQARDLLSAALRALGTGLAAVRRFLVTHLHRDHFTQAVTLRKEYGGRISLGRGEEPSLRATIDPARPAFAAQLAVLRRAGAGPLIERLRALGAPAHDPAVWEHPDDWLRDQQVVALPGRTLVVLETPGHTAGHVVFRDAMAGLLFAGDHVLPHITPSIGFEPVPSPLPLRDYLGSLRTVRALPDTRLLPAHGPVTGSVHQRVDELLDHHDARLTRMARAVRGGADTAYRTATVVTWTRRCRAFDELDPFNQMLAVQETLAHLELLVTQGRMCATDNGGVRHYGETVRAET